MTSDNKIVIMAIDPGCNHLGHSRLEYDIKKKTVTVTHYDCFSSSDLARREKRKDVKEYGNVISLFMCEREIERIYNEYQPDYCVSEGAFVHRFPQAFASLCLCINSIQRVLYTHGKSLYKIAPKEAKKAIGNATADKDAVFKAIHKIKDLKVIHTETKRKKIW